MEEKDVDYWVVRELAKIGLDGIYTVPEGTPLAKSLERASKRKTKKNGKPDVIVYTDDLILVIEDKHGADKHVVKGVSPFDSAVYVPDLDEEPKDTAEGGAQWYLSCMIQDWPDNEPRPHVFALGISGFIEDGIETYAVRPFAWFKGYNDMVRLPKLNDLSVFSSDNINNYVRKCRASLAHDDLRKEFNKIDRFLNPRGVRDRYFDVIIPQFLMMGNPGFTERDNRNGMSLALEHMSGSRSHGLKRISVKNNRLAASDYIRTNWGLLSDSDRMSLSALITEMATLSPPSYKWLVSRLNPSEARAFETVSWIALSLFRRKMLVVCEDHAARCRMLSALFDTTDFVMTARVDDDDLIGLATCSMVLQGKEPCIYPSYGTPNADIVLVDAFSADDSFDCILSSASAMGSGGKIIAVVSRYVAESETMVEGRSRVGRKLTLLASLKSDNERYVLVFKRGKMTASTVSFADTSRMTIRDNMLDRAFGLLSDEGNARAFDCEDPVWGYAVGRRRGVRTAILCTLPGSMDTRNPTCALLPMRSYRAISTRSDTPCGSMTRIGDAMRTLPSPPTVWRPSEVMPVTEYLPPSRRTVKRPPSRRIMRNGASVELMIEASSCASVMDDG